MSLDQGAIAAFVIGVPLAVWGFVSYLRGNARTTHENESLPSGKQERKIKKYTSDGRPVQ